MQQPQKIVHSRGLLPADNTALFFIPAALIALGLIFQSACASPSATPVAAPLSAPDYSAEATVEANAISWNDSHVYAGIRMPGPVPSGFILKKETSNEFFREWYLTKYEQFDIATIRSVIDGDDATESVVQIELLKAFEHRADAEEFFLIAKSALTEKFRLLPLRADEEFAQWKFRTRDEWILKARRNKEMSRFGWHKPESGFGISDTLKAAGVYKVFRPELGRHLILVTYETPQGIDAESARKEALKKSLGL